MRQILISLSGYSNDPNRIIERMSDYVNGRPTDFNSNGGLCYGAVADYIKKHGAKRFEVILLGSGGNSYHGILIKGTEVVVDTMSNSGAWQRDHYKIFKANVGKGRIVDLPKPWRYDVVRRFPASKLQD